MYLLIMDSHKVGLRASGHRVDHHYQQEFGKSHIHWRKSKKHDKVDLLLHNDNKYLVISYLLTIVSAPKFDIPTWSTIDFKSLPIKCHNSQCSYLFIKHYGPIKLLEV